MRGRIKASYTVEAAFVMAVVLWSLFVSIQAAYGLRDRVVGAMALEEASERLRHNETEQQAEAPSWAANRAGLPFSWDSYDFQIKLYGSFITGRQVKSAASGGKWSLKLEQGVFDPEDFLRRLSVFNQEGKDENSIQTGNET